MGLFNVIMKGVKVEHRPREKKKDEETVTGELSQLEMENIFNQIQADFSATETSVPENLNPPLIQPEPPAPVPVQPPVEQISMEQTPRATAASILFSNTMPAAQHPHAPAPVFNAAPAFAGGALGGATLGNRNILVVTPRTHTDVTSIIENLNNGDPCIVTLDSMSAADAQRRLDFLNGVVCATGGTIRPLDTAKYILTPSGLGVRS